jgi:hypothetical protein
MGPEEGTAYLIPMTCGDLAAQRGMAHAVVMERANDDGEDVQKIWPK